MAVFKSRVQRYETEKRRCLQASKIQAWWHRQYPQLVAVREVQAQKLQCQEILESRIAMEDFLWKMVHHLDETQCYRQLQRTGRALQCRRVLFKLLIEQRRRLRAATILKRNFQVYVAKCIKERKYSERKRYYVVQRRVQEVRRATLTIQSTWRMFQCVLLRREKKRHLALRHAQAAKIQRWVRRRILYPHFVACMRAAKKDLIRWYVRSESRRRAATKLQSIWRMFRARKEFTSLKRFMFVDRHVFAGKIQRLVRRYLARRTWADREITLAAVRQDLALRELRDSSAKKIQSLHRMLKIKKQKFQRYIVVPRDVREVAAVHIQRMWRGFAAYQYVVQLKMARANATRRLIDAEHLHMYAVQIQSVARRAFCNPKFVEAAKGEKKTMAVLVIQRNIRMYLDRLRLIRLGQEENEKQHEFLADEEKSFMATRIQTAFRGHRQCRRYAQALTAVRVIQRCWKFFTSKRATKELK